MPKERAFFQYIRDKSGIQTVQIRMEGFSQAELVDLILGLWGSMKAQDRKDVHDLIASFSHNPTADAEFPATARTIADGLGNRIQRLS